MNATTAQPEAITTRHCPSCAATPGSNCTTSSGARVSPSKTHKARLTGAMDPAPAAAPTVTETPAEPTEAPRRRTSARLGAYVVLVLNGDLAPVIVWHYAGGFGAIALPGLTTARADAGRALSTTA